MDSSVVGLFCRDVFDGVRSPALRSLSVVVSSFSFEVWVDVVAAGACVFSSMAVLVADDSPSTGPDSAEVMSRSRSFSAFLSSALLRPSRAMLRVFSLSIQPRPRSNIISTKAAGIVT